MLEENENNIDKDTGYLSNNVVADCFERFQNILSKIPTLKHESLKKEINLYHKDFLTFISSGLGDNKNHRLIGPLLLRRLGKKLNLNPIRLHTYWWTKSDIIISELQLANVCPSIINEINEDISDNFEDFKKISWI